MFQKLFQEEISSETDKEAFWQKKALLWKEIQERKKALEAEEKACREALIELAGDETKKGFGVKVTKYQLTGRIQYEKIPELQQVDLDKYRAPVKEAWRISVDKPPSPQSR
ncbi:MAG: hypothetical protein KDK62_02915 [Chlamydiia bacterium]|nr:hypothetical protein [Chlamydiia bacterium]